MHLDDQSQIFNHEDEITFSDLAPDGKQETVLHKFLQSLSIKFVARTAEEEEDNECDFDLRMTDVPDEVLDAHDEADIFEARVASIGKQIWTRTPRKRLLASTLLLTLVALLIGVSSLSHTILSLFPLFPGMQQANQSLQLHRDVLLGVPVSHNEENYVSSGPNTSAMVTSRAIPNYCPIGTMLGQGKQIGNFPVWIIGIDGTANVHLPPVILQTIKDWKGWMIPLHIRGRYKYIDSITLTVFNIGSTSSPLLQEKSTPVISSRLFLDTKHITTITGTSIRAIETWDVSLYIPSAGCYGLSAAWGTGHWMINFAAGK